MWAVRSGWRGPSRSKKGGGDVVIAAQNQPPGRPDDSLNLHPPDIRNLAGAVLL